MVAIEELQLLLTARDSSGPAAASFTRNFQQMESAARSSAQRLTSGMDGTTGAIRNADRAAGNARGSFSGLGDVLRTATGFAVGLLSVQALGGLVHGLTAPKQAASDLNESLNKVGVVFGQSADAVKVFASTAATGLGQSQRQALEAAETLLPKVLGDDAH